MKCPNCGRQISASYLETALDEENELRTQCPYCAAWFYEWELFDEDNDEDSDEDWEASVYGWDDEDEDDDWEDEEFDDDWKLDVENEADAPARAAPDEEEEDDER
jgi:hypothetical protein